MTKLPAFFGHDRVLTSNPSLQAPSLAEANDFTGVPNTSETDVFFETVYPKEQTKSGVEIREYILKDGGHTWPGRETSGGRESWISWLNGKTAPRDRFDANKEIVRFFGLDGRLKVARDLESAGQRSR